MFIYLLIVRTRDISETFWLLDDQIRDWLVALRPWHDLPIGVPSAAGGTTLGPVYYWTMWGIRHLVGPWTDNLPHAGGIGLSIIQTMADVFFCAAIWKKTSSGWLAIAVALFVATEPYDMALTAAMWNTELAVAFVKVTLALALIAGDGRSIWWTVATTMAAWLAVQAHSTAFFVAGPVIAAFPLREALDRRWARAMQHLCASLEVMFVLEVPLLIDVLRHPPNTLGPSKVFYSIAYTVSHPAAIHLAATFNSVTGALGFLLSGPGDPSWFSTVLTLCTMVTAVRLRRDLIAASVTVIPLIAIVIGFSLWQLPFDNYYCLSVAPSAAFTIALALTPWRPSARLVSVALVVCVIALQPSRLASSRAFLRFPQYGALARGSLEIRRRVADIQGIGTEFSLPPATDPDFLYTILGGRITPDAQYRAIIDANGSVRFDLVKP